MAQDVTAAEWLIGPSPWHYVGFEDKGWAWTCNLRGGQPWYPKWHFMVKCIWIVINKQCLKQCRGPYYNEWPCYFSFQLAFEGGGFFRTEYSPVSLLIFYRGVLSIIKVVMEISNYYCKIVYFPLQMAQCLRLIFWGSVFFLCIYFYNCYNVLMDFHLSVYNVLFCLL